VSAFRDERRIALQFIQLDCRVGCLFFDLCNLGSVEMMLGHKLVKLGGVLGQVRELCQMVDLVTLGFHRRMSVISFAMLMVFARMIVLPFAMRSALVLPSTRWIGGRMRDGDRAGGSGRTRISRIRNGGRQAQSQQNIGKLHFAKNGLWNKWANKIQSKSITEISDQPKGWEKD
jgi:hypothetical protein